MGQKISKKRGEKEMNKTIWDEAGKLAKMTVKGMTQKEKEFWCKILPDLEKREAKK